MPLLDLLLPPACAACGSFGAVLCPGCVRSLRPASDPEDAFLAPHRGVVIGEALDAAVAAFRYEGPLRRALARLKYAGARRLAEPLAAAAQPWLEHVVAVAQPDVLVPVPVHPGRLRERGYNQAMLLAAALGASAGLRVVELLRRSRPTTQQHRLDRAARLHNLRAAFAMAEGTRAPPAILLVDDILTTSATFEACATILQASGAEHVWGLAVAREI